MSHEAVELLSQYLQIDTTNPPGNEKRGVAFFARIFEEEGIVYKTYEACAGRGSIKAVIPGTGEKGAIILLNHIDVVPARADEWSIHPFSGKIQDGFIHGRGALDMKGQGILELLAFLEVKRKGLTPCRDIIFLAVADEEAGAQNGVAYLLNNYADDFQADGLEYAVQEHQDRKNHDPTINNGGNCVGSKKRMVPLRQKWILGHLQSQAPLAHHLVQDLAGLLPKVGNLGDVRHDVVTIESQQGIRVEQQRTNRADEHCAEADAV